MLLWNKEASEAWSERLLMLICDTEASGLWSERLVVLAIVNYLKTVVYRGQTIQKCEMRRELEKGA
jgi:hypothetical protein